MPFEEIPQKVMSVTAKLTGSQLSKLTLHILERLPPLKLQWALERAVSKILLCLCVSYVMELLTLMSKIAPGEALLQVADRLLCSVASKSGLSWNVKGLQNTACRAVCELQTHGRTNMAYFFCRCIAGKKGPLLSTDPSCLLTSIRLIQYQLEFFNVTHVCQVAFVVCDNFL